MSTAMPVFTFPKLTEPEQPAVYTSQMSSLVTADGEDSQPNVPMPPANKVDSADFQPNVTMNTPDGEDLQSGAETDDSIASPIQDHHVSFSSNVSPSGAKTSDLPIFFVSGSTTDSDSDSEQEECRPWRPTPSLSYRGKPKISFLFHFNFLF